MSRGKAIIYTALIAFMVAMIILAIYAGVQAYNGDWVYLWIFVGVCAIVGISLWLIWRGIKSVFNEMDEHEHSER